MVGVFPPDATMPHLSHVVLTDPITGNTVCKNCGLGREKYLPFGPEWNLVCIPKDAVNHPAHYGGKDDPYEAIKVIEAWSLGFNLGNTTKYIARAGKKGAKLEDLKKARWYLDREIENLERYDNENDNNKQAPFV